MTYDQLDEFEKAVGQLQGLYDELSVTSKKAPDGGLNPFKLRLVNKLIGLANGVLGAQYRPFDDFSEFDSDDVPTNSDAVLVLAQYLQCFEKLRADNVENLAGNWCWKIEDSSADDGFSYRQTVRPKRLRE